MKKSARFLWGTLIIGTAFALTGCPTDGGGNDGDPSAEELAGRLRGDLNKLGTGSATVDGATVTLAGRVAITSDLTVPEGVTLDLTGDGELALVDAALTVNGTVNAGPGKVRLDDDASEGTIQLKGQGHLLVVQGTKTLTLDGVTLAGVADNNEPLVGVYEGGAFVMKSGAITGNTHIRSDEWAGGGGVGVWEGGTFTMQGGTISGNTAESDNNSGGGGVRVNDGCAFTMEGGTISGNTAQGDTWAGGGGVYTEQNSAFTMTDGTISGNTAQGGGGGMFIHRNSTFTMAGGEIFGNTGDVGGGVWINGASTFTMEGGTIYGKSDRLPSGMDPSLANSAKGNSALNKSSDSTAEWGTGGTYKKGNVSQPEGTNIDSTDETLIAIP
jgi:hypothetical protein